MYIHDLNPVLISFGFFEIRWYSLAYIFGILIGWLLCKKIFISNTNINEKFDVVKNPERWRVFQWPVSYTHLTLPTNREV